MGVHQALAVPWRNGGSMKADTSAASSGDTSQKTISRVATKHDDDTAAVMTCAVLAQTTMATPRADEAKMTSLCLWSGKNGVPSHL